MTWTTTERRETPRGARSRGLCHALALAGWGLTVLAAAGREARPLPEVRLAKRERGEAAVRAAGANFGEIAAHYGLTEEKLRGRMARDPELWMDTSGRLLYVCAEADTAVVVAAAEAPATGPAAAPAGATADPVFQLHSRPGSPRVIHLDFDGHVTTGTVWNTDRGRTQLVTPPYDVDGNPASFSPDELARVRAIWERVAEDYSMFDVDVTTEEPGVDAFRRNYFDDPTCGTKVCIGGSATDWYGSGAGGAAYIGAFTSFDATPCFVFENNLGNGAEKAVAEAASHECGHTLGLYHHGTATSVYYAGHGAWAPIMGSPYARDVTQWSKGEYAGANNPDDDLATMTVCGMIYRDDDHGNSTHAATELSGTNLAAAGVIERREDLDYFAFQTGAGTIRLAVTPAARGPDLDVLASLHDSAGTRIAWTNPPSLAATITVTVAAGRYYLVVDGTSSGTVNTGYSDYGSLGQYTVSGQVVPPPAPAGPEAWLPVGAGTYTWTNPAHWSPSGIPDGVGRAAQLENNIAGGQTIRVEQPVALASLGIGDADGSHGFVVEAGAGGLLRLDTTTGPARIVKTRGKDDTIRCALDLCDPLTVSNAVAATLTLAGGIAGTSGLTKAGAGVVTLAGTNAYAGDTVVREGTLRVTAPGAVAGSRVVEVRAGARLDASSLPLGLPFAGHQTLCGDGTVQGPVSVAGVLSPGLDGIGRLRTEAALRLAGRTVLEIGRTNGALVADRVSVGGVVTYGGTLAVSNLTGGALARGDTVRVFEAGGYRGSFAALELPALPARLVWDTRRLAVDGTLAVALDLDLAPPAIPSWSLNPEGNGIAMSISAVATATYVLESTPTLINPVWTPVRTVAGVDGILSLDIPFDPAHRVLLYRLCAQ